MKMLKLCIWVLACWSLVTLTYYAEDKPVSKEEPEGCPEWVVTLKNQLNKELESKLPDQKFTITDACPFIFASPAGVNTDEMVKKAQTAFSILSRTLFSRKLGGNDAIKVIFVKDKAILVKLMNNPNAAGGYTPAVKTLFINTDTGPGTFLHELTHALHFADMTEAGQRHPIWLIEGLGSLYEQAATLESIKNNKPSRMLGLVNWRLAQLRNDISNGSNPSLKQLLQKYTDWNQNDNALNAVARYFMKYLQDKGNLAMFYKSYKDDYDKDPSGLTTLEKVCGKNIDAIEKDWLAWVQNLPADANQEIPAMQQKTDRLMDEGSGLASNGDYSKAAQKFNEARDADPTNPEVLYNIALIQTCLGLKDKAIETFGQAFAAGYDDYETLKANLVDPACAPVRDDNRFKQLVKEYFEADEKSDKPKWANKPR